MGKRQLQLFCLLLVFLITDLALAKKKCTCQTEENQSLNLYPKGYKEELRRAIQKNKDPSNIQTKFMLYNEGDSADTMCQIVPLEPETLEKCGFNATFPLVMIVHGWSIDGRLEDWILKMAYTFKSSGKQINIVVADWLASAFTHYATAVQNTRFIGLEIAEFLEWLESSIQFPRSNVHLIGYSLGAHVSGFAGTYVNGSDKIGRITGLDPAGPLFEGMSVTDRLSPDDATIVDAIHTNTRQHVGLSIGINQQVGHYDFYPNGGIKQPGCDIKGIYDYIIENGLFGFTQTVKCAHERSVHLFIDSIQNEDKHNIGYECKDYESFEKGMCLNCRKHGCVALGYNLHKRKKPSGHRFFLKTRPQMPYKVYHYQFKIKIVNQMADKYLFPQLIASLMGTKQDVETLPLIIAEGIKADGTYSFLITLHTDIGDIMVVKLKWDGINGLKNFWYSIQTKLLPGNLPGLLVKNIGVLSGDTQDRITFCSENIDDFKLLPDQEKTYVRCSKKLKNKKSRKMEADKDKIQPSLRTSIPTSFSTQIGAIATSML